MVPEELLATYVALPGTHEPTGACVAWVESRGERCGHTTDHLLCARHVQVAQRRHATDQEKTAKRRARAAADRARNYPKWRHRLTQIDKRLKELDVPPPTDDMAAYGGQGMGQASRDFLDTSLADWRVKEIAALHRERESLVRQIGDTK